MKDKPKKETFRPLAKDCGFKNQQKVQKLQMMKVVPKKGARRR